MIDVLVIERTTNFALYQLQPRNKRNERKQQQQQQAFASAI